MAARIFDPTAFRGQGGLITFGALLGGHAAAKPDGFPDLKDLSNKVLSVYLRWQVNPRIGLPSEPFKVWRRPAMPLGQEIGVNPAFIALPPLGHVMVFDEPVVSFSATVQAGATPKSVIVLPVADGVGFENILGILSFDLTANGSRAFTFQAPYITGALLLNTSSLSSLSALPMSAAGKVAGWELIETVGLPVDQGAWQDLAGQNHGVDQGLVGAPQPAKDAAANRFSRGINPYGWHPLFPTGQAAPQWALPAAADLIAEAETELLPMLHDAMTLPPEAQAFFTRQFVIKPPESNSGNQMNAQDGSAQVAPLTLLQMAAATDPLQAVILGFGTGYLYQDVPAVKLGAIELFGNKDVSDWDFMVTGLWANGLDGQSNEIEYAALIPRPRKVIPAPAPADLKLDFLGHHQPAAADQPWTAATRLSWERAVLDNLTSVASFAVGRSDLANADPAAALMERHFIADGHMPIGDARNPDDPERVRQSATDSAFAIPNDPGTVGARYGVATQNIFGIWSPWVTVPFQSTQPDPDLVQIVDANLVPTDPGAPATVCPATLQVDFVLDWRVRRIQSVQFRGRLFAAANRHQAPPGGFPAGVQKSLAGPAAAITINFSGDAPAGLGAAVKSLDPQGENEVAPGPATQGQSRRYRMSVTGFQLDYASTPHVGLALQAQQTEAIAPSRSSAWTPQPKVAYASDPRARSTSITPIVPLASLPDAVGECHARVAWAHQPAADGYAVYTSNEFALLERTGQPHPSSESTLSERLVALKAAFNANNDRNAFTRINDLLVTTTSLDVTLPRGSQAIHCWIVIPVSAGGVEGPWPSGPAAADDLLVYAAPKIAEPAPPRIEVRRIADGPGFAAAVRVETRGTSGAYPRRIDLYRTRVADAARRLDSMGFPIAEISASSGAWMVEPSSPAPDEWIDTVSGTDSPGGSWQYVWYRAAAWADPIPERGVLGGRSTASPAAPVVIPPDGPPPLGMLSASWPGGGTGNVQIDFTSAASVAPTPLGPHRLHVQVIERGVQKPLISSAYPLQEIPDAAPSGTSSGIWRVAGGDYRLLVRRTDVANPASVTVRLVDPIGRSSERNYRIEEGSILPVPELSIISSFTITGRGKVYAFTIGNASDEAIGGEFYRLSLTLQLADRGPSILTQPIERLTPNLRIGRFTARTIPLPGPMITARPGRGGTQFTDRGDTLTYSSPVGDIPTTPPSETFSVSRQRIGDRINITLTARAKLRSVEARVVSPDGTAVTRRARG